MIAQKIIVCTREMSSIAMYTTSKIQFLFHFQHCRYEFSNTMHIYLYIHTLKCNHSTLPPFVRLPLLLQNVGIKALNLYVIWQIRGIESAKKTGDRHTNPIGIEIETHLPKIDFGGKKAEKCTTLISHIQKLNQILVVGELKKRKKSNKCSLETKNLNRPLFSTY